MAATGLHGMSMHSQPDVSGTSLYEHIMSQQDYAALASRLAEAEKRRSELENLLMSRLDQLSHRLASDLSGGKAALRLLLPCLYWCASCAYIV